MKNSTTSVFYIGNFLLPDGNAACQRVFSNAKLMNSIGMKSHVISNNYNYFCELREYEGVQCYSSNYSGSRWGRVFQFVTNSWLRGLVKKLHSQGDVIVLYNAPIFLIFAMYFYCRWRKSKLVLDLSEYYSSAGLRFPNSLLKFIDTFVRMNVCPVLADGVITTSSLLTKKYQKFSCCVIELPTLFDCRSFSSPIIREDDITKLVYCGNPFNLSRKVVKERLDILINAVSFIDSASVHLDIIGTTEAAFKCMYPAYSDLLPVMPSNIVFHGILPRIKVLGFLKNSDFQVFFRDATLANRAGFPTKLSESVSSGLPVITNKLDGVLRYKDARFLVMCNKGAEKKTILDCVNLSRQEKNSLKNEAFNSSLFDYRKYREEMEVFIASVIGLT